MMDWVGIHQVAQEFNLWSGVAINTWAIATAIAFGLSRMFGGRKFTPGEAARLAFGIVAGTISVSLSLFGMGLIIVKAVEWILGPLPVWAEWGVAVLGILLLLAVWFWRLHLEAEENRRTRSR